MTFYEAALFVLQKEGTEGVARRKEGDKENDRGSEGEDYSCLKTRAHALDLSRTDILRGEARHAVAEGDKRCNGEGIELY